MKAQRDAESGKKGVASFAFTDGLRVSVTFNLPAKMPASNTHLPPRVTTAIDVASLNEGQLRFLDL